MMDRLMKNLLKLWFGLTYLFLFTPIFIVILMSFNTSPYGTFPFQFTGQWYYALFTESQLFPATWLSIKLSVSVALTAGFLGTLTARGMTGLSRKGVGFFTGMTIIPIVVPWLVLGIAMLLVVSFVGLGRGMLALFLGNLVITLPYVVLIVYTRLVDIDPALEDAARNLGAGPRRVLFQIVMPIAAPAILAGTLMALMVCFNSFIIQYFLSPFGVRTLPLEIFNLIKVGYRPDMNALASILVLISFSAVVTIGKLQGSVEKLF